MKFRLKIYIFLFAVASIINACTKGSYDNRTTENTNLSNTAFIRVFSGVLNGSRNFVYYDNIPMTGTGLNLRSIFPSSAPFAGIPTGSRTILIRDTLSATTQKAVSLSNNFEAGKYYTIFTYDTVTAAKAMIINDVFTVPADTTSLIRFVNLAHSLTPMPNLDVYSRRLKANLFTNISAIKATDFVTYAPTGLTDTLEIRQTGTSTLLLQANSITYPRQRVFTLVFTGRQADVSGTFARTLTSYITF